MSARIRRLAGEPATGAALEPAGGRDEQLRLGEQRGMRLLRVPEAAVLEALAAHRSVRGPDDPRVLKWDERSRTTAANAGERRVVVKEYLAGGILRRLADLWRGSPARRAWRGGHGLLARQIGAATPLAFLEPRGLRPAAGSLLVLEDLRPDRPADRCAAEANDPAPIVDALTRLAVALHRGRVIHGDLKASHVYLGLRGGQLEPRLIDLEGVRFARHLGDRRRIRALAELNASLPDAVSDAVRRRAFARYAAALPFRRSSDASLSRVVRLSLARAHRWTGTRCQLARNR